MSFLWPVEEDLPTWLRVQYPFERQVLRTAEGHRLSYVDEGHGECIFLFHGNPTWSFHYRHLISQLREQFRCVALDHLGCGLSDKPKHYHYSLDNHIANASALVEKVQARAFHLILHDWGCPIGLAIAELYAERVQSLVILNGAAFVSKNIPWPIALAKTRFPGTLLVRGLNGFAWAATSLCVRKELPEEVRRGYLFPYDSWAHRIAINAFVKDIPLKRRHRSWKTLQTIEEQVPILRGKPVLLAWGMKDFCFTGAFLKKWQEFFPDAQTLCFPQAGHWVLEDANPEILEKIQVFLTA
ncbi:MAG: alpha/beta fold hydrolase [Puniceicoccales bacterium]|nr:alpha/beta fold hydrolase [Puniceicoccales bacterium]